MFKIIEEIVIDAPVDSVWRVLTDFPQYGAWNPFLRSIEGEWIPGQRLRVQVQAPGSRAREFFPIVTYRKENSELRWLGVFGFRFLFDGDHRFIVSEIAQGRTRFVQEEKFSGIFVPLNPHVVRGIRRGFVQMNQALKKRVESGAS